MARWITFDEVLTKDRMAVPIVATGTRPCSLNLDGYGKFWGVSLLDMERKPVLGIAFSDTTVVFGDAAKLHQQLGGEDQNI